MWEQRDDNTSEPDQNDRDSYLNFDFLSAQSKPKVTLLPLVYCLFKIDVFGHFKCALGLFPVNMVCWALSFNVKNMNFCVVFCRIIIRY